MGISSVVAIPKLEFTKDWQARNLFGVRQLVFGDGYSYGAEFFLKKRLGQFSGWIGYTYSKTMRRFPDINEGVEFPAKYDRRNDLSIVGSYELNDRWTFGAVFIYATGNAITLPAGWYSYENEIQYEYGPRTSTRMVPYHRAGKVIALPVA